MSNKSPKAATPRNPDDYNFIESCDNLDGTMMNTWQMLNSRETMPPENWKLPTRDYKPSNACVIDGDYDRGAIMPRAQWHEHYERNQETNQLRKIEKLAKKPQPSQATHQTWILGAPATKDTRNATTKTFRHIGGYTGLEQMLEYLIEANCNGVTHNNKNCVFCPAWKESKDIVPRNAFRSWLALCLGVGRAGESPIYVFPWSGVEDYDGNARFDEFLEALEHVMVHRMKLLGPT